MPGEDRGEHTRKPIRADLPAEVRALLEELERLADDAGLSFARLVREISKDGERLRPPYVTRWREGTAFPSEDTVTRWTQLCHGDVEHSRRLRTLAESAYRSWRRAHGRRPPGNPPQAPAQVKETLAPPPPADELAAATAPVGRHHARTALVALLLTVAATAVAARWAADAGEPDGGDGRRPSPPAALAVPPCSWPNRAPEHPVVDTTVPPWRRGQTMYRVPSGSGSRDVPVVADGAALQPFVATSARIDKASAIIGIDGARADPLGSFPVRFDILRPRGDGSPRVLGSGDTTVNPQNVNKDVDVTFTPPVDVTPGEIYVLRVTNRSSSPIGIYVNVQHGPDRAVPYPADVCVTGAIDPFTPAGLALSGAVSALT